MIIKLDNPRILADIAETEMEDAALKAIRERLEELEKTKQADLQGLGPHVTSLLFSILPGYECLAAVGYYLYVMPSFY